MKSDIDYSKFKKISQDKKVAVMVHPDGHKISIAIGSLGPSMRKKLEALPVHAAEGVDIQAPDTDYPEGKEVSKIEETPEDLAAVEKEELSTPQPSVEQVPTGGSQDPEPTVPVASAPSVASAPMPQETSPQSSATGTPFQSEKARIPATPVSPIETPEQHYANEIAFQQDLANRHIEPKTYSSMFADKSTLGKIGTIFGLMLSGAGSGLAHQENALLSMMNKEIDRDLDAQKTSKANANTFLKTQFDHDMQQAQALHMSNQNALIAQQIAASQAEVAGKGQANKAVNKQITEKAGGKWDESLEKQVGPVGADLAAKNKMLSTVVQHLDDITPNNPQAKAMIQNTIKPLVDAEIQQNVVKINQMKTKAAQQKVLKDQNEVAGTGVVDMDKYHKMLDSGTFNKQHNIPMNSKRDINPEDDSKIQEAISQKTKVANNYRDVMEAYNALAAMPNAGETPVGLVTESFRKVPWIGDALANVGKVGQGQMQRPRDQLIDALSQRLSANGASAETMDMMKRALSPTMFDTPKTLDKGAELVHQHFNHAADFHPGVLQKYGLDKDLPKISFDSSKIPKKNEVKEEAPKEEGILSHFKKWKSGE